MSIVQYLQLDEDIKWNAFYYGVRHDNFDDIVTTVKSYLHADSKYLFSKETTPNGHAETDGQHIHVVCQMSATQYTNCTMVIKRRYKLNGDRRSGQTGQYGKVRSIKNIDTMLAYCMKDGDFITNIEPDQVEKLKQLSYQKVEAPTGEKTKKTTKTWCERTAEEIIAKYPAKQWNMGLADDGKRFNALMFEHLGKSAKAFDSHIYDRLACGVYNRLPRTTRAVEDFETSLAEKFNARFGYQY